MSLTLKYFKIVAYFMLRTEITSDVSNVFQILILSAHTESLSRPAQWHRCVVGCTVHFPMCYPSECSSFSNKAWQTTFEVGYTLLIDILSTRHTTMIDARTSRGRDWLRATRLPSGASSMSSKAPRWLCTRTASTSLGKSSFTQLYRHVSMIEARASRGKRLTPRDMAASMSSTS